MTHKQSSHKSRLTACANHDNSTELIENNCLFSKSIFIFAVELMILTKKLSEEIISNMEPVRVAKCIARNYFQLKDTR